MKKIIRLNENDLVRIVRRVIKEDEMSASGLKKPRNYDMSDLIGKTVEFTLINMTVIRKGDRYNLDEGDMSEYGMDKFFKKAFNTKLQGTIVEAETGSYGDVLIKVKQSRNGHPLFARENNDISSFLYNCGKENFRIDLSHVFLENFKKRGEILKDSWFYNSEHIMFYYECPKLEEHLQNRPPCGGFDFSMNKNGMDNNDSFT